jgi:glycerophosphoryl diester phosphodiesterase
LNDKIVELLTQLSSFANDINSNQDVINTKLRLKRSVFDGTMNLLFHNSLALIIGQGIILLLFILLFVPLVTFGLEVSLEIANISYVKLANVWRLLSNPFSLLILVFLMYIISQFILIEIYFLTLYFTVKENQKRVRLTRILITTLYKVLAGIRKGNLRHVFAAWVTIMVANLPMVFFIIRKSRFLVNLFEGMSNGWVWLVGSLIFLTFLVVLIYRKAFVFHYFLIKKVPFGDSTKQSHVVRYNHPNLTLMYYLGWNVYQAVFLTLVYALVIVLSMLIVSTTMDKRIAVAAFITLNEKINVYMAILMILVSTISHFALFTHLFYHYELAPETFAIDKVYVPNPLKKAVYQRIGILAFAVLFTVNVVFFIGTMRNGSVINAISLDDIQITAHRGFSKEVPENTLLAIEKAMEEQADNIEVDVRSTKDGVLVLHHDASLKRTTGLKKMLKDVTYDEIKELDAGSWLKKDFAHLSIPTLREVFELTKGEAFLNIDLKYSKNQDYIVNHLVELIHEYNMEWQCIVTSTNQGYLREIKEIDPNIKTGYITQQFSAAVVKNDYIDVLSLKSNLVTKSVVEKIYQNGKQVFVWTVNSQEEIERVSRLGVDNIITDNPVFAREVIFQSRSDSYLVTLIKILAE